jgi:hypothetical protein
MSVSADTVAVQAKQLTCDQCSHGWLSIARYLPEKCPSCRTRAWNGQKQPHWSNQIALPAPRGRGRPKTLTETTNGFEFDPA